VPTLEDIVERLRPAIVQFTYVDFAAPQGSGPLGSGFIVNRDGVVATAQHVVKEAEDYVARGTAGSRRVGIGLAYPVDAARGNFRVTPYDVIGEDQRHDLAIVQMREDPFTSDITGMTHASRDVRLRVSAVELATGRPRDGLSIAISGYPLGQPVLVTTAGIIASSWATDVQAVNSPTKTADVYLGDVQTNDGNSGGPAYRQGDGAVIGVLVSSPLTDVFELDAAGEAAPSGFLTSADLSMIVPVQYLTDLMDAHSVVWTAKTR
jgi:S1-C subfamily serine protease